MNPAKMVNVSAEAWNDWLKELCELPDPKGEIASVPLAERPKGATAVDEYAISAYAEAMRADAIDEDLAGVLADLELQSLGDPEADWAQIKAFYAERGYIVVCVEHGQEDRDEWIFDPRLLRRLGFGELPS